MELEGRSDAQAGAGAKVAVLLRVEEAADQLGIARTMMFRLVREGEVESVLIGRLRRVPVVCLDEYVEKLRRRSDGPSAA